MNEAMTIQARDRMDCSMAQALIEWGKREERQGCEIEPPACVEASEVGSRAMTSNSRAFWLVVPPFLQRATPLIGDGCIERNSHRFNNGCA